MSRLVIRKLVVSGTDRDDAALEFESGLNFLRGPSNTGKTHVVECIDFALGSRDVPRHIPEADGYDTVTLDIELDGVAYTIIRRLDQTDKVQIVGPSEAPDSEQTEEVTLPEKSAAGPPGTRELKVQISRSNPTQTLSGWLTAASGFDPSMAVLSNDRGKQTALSFRTVAPFVLVDEASIIRETSPLLSGNATQFTSARSIFRTMLTGEPPTDDELLLESAHERRDSASERAGVLEVLIADARQTIEDHNWERPQLEANLTGIDEELERISDAVSAGGELLNEKIARRNAALVRANEHHRLAHEKRELRTRFDLLARHYRSDIERLEFVLEGGHFFDQIAASHCPTCGRAFDGQECHPENADFKGVERACRAEIRALKPRLNDLAEAAADAGSDEQQLTRRAEHAADEARALTVEIEQDASPSADLNRARLKDLVQRRKDVENSLGAFRDLDRLIATREEFLAEAKAALAKYRPTQDTKALAELSTRIETLLRTSGFPTGSGVHFSLDTEDLVIDGKPRGENGKGVRAVTHAAFTIGLMEHCLALDTPHPGFVVIDTPLNPYKGESGAALEAGALTDTVHAAFLAAIDASVAGQAIIVENVEVPQGLELSNQIEFSRSSEAGRYGFYPTAVAGQGEDAGS